jgi:hypothetical protein
MGKRLVGHEKHKRETGMKRLVRGKETEMRIGLERGKRQKQDMLGRWRDREETI